MLPGEAQEETRIVYTARRDYAKGGEDLLLSHMTEATAILKSLKDVKRTTCDQTSTPKTRIVGLLLMVALGLASETEVDSFFALKSMLLEESP